MHQISINGMSAYHPKGNSQPFFNRLTLRNGQRGLVTEKDYSNSLRLHTVDLLGSRYRQQTLITYYLCSDNPIGSGHPVKLNNLLIEEK